MSDWPGTSGGKQKYPFIFVFLLFTAIRVKASLYTFQWKAGSPETQGVANHVNSGYQERWPLRWGRQTWKIKIVDNVSEFSKQEMKALIKLNTLSWEWPT